MLLISYLRSNSLKEARKALKYPTAELLDIAKDAYPVKAALTAA